MRVRTKRWIWTACVAVLVVWLGFMGFVGWAMRQPPAKFGSVMARMPMPAFFLFPFETMWTHARSGSLQPGDVAPALTLERLGDHQPVPMASLWEERPVALVFGSYT